LHFAFLDANRFLYDYELDANRESSSIEQSRSCQDLRGAFGTIYSATGSLGLAQYLQIWILARLELLSSPDIALYSVLCRLIYCMDLRNSASFASGA
jgi:hypothetical protein